MYPQTLADLLKQWLTAANHPGITTVRTCAEVGRWEQPVGVVVALSNGWRFVLQLVGAYPPGGAAAENPATARPETFQGSWEDRPDYQTARKTFEAEMGAYDGPRSKRPQASVGALLAAVLDVMKRADHPEITAVEVSRSTPASRDVLRVTSDDGATVYGLPAGYIPPGAVDLSHPAHQTPAEWN